MRCQSKIHRKLISRKPKVGVKNKHFTSLVHHLPLRKRSLRPVVVSLFLTRQNQVVDVERLQIQLNKNNSNLKKKISSIERSSAITKRLDFGRFVAHKKQVKKMRKQRNTQEGLASHEFLCFQSNLFFSLYEKRKKH